MTRVNSLIFKDLRALDLEQTNKNQYSDVQMLKSCLWKPLFIRVPQGHYLKPDPRFKWIKTVEFLRLQLLP